MNNYPSSYYISSGTGTSAFKMVAFDNALISAGISNYNLVKVSSILPRFCKRKDAVDLQEGSPLLTAYASISSDIYGTQLATAVAVGVPKDPSSIGVIMEYEGIGISAKEAENYAEKMVEEAMNNHKIDIENILITSAEGIVEDKYLALVSAIVIW